MRIFHIYVAWYYRECDHRNCTYVNGFRSLTPVDGWVFLVGQSLPSVPDGKRFDQMFATLAAKFSKVQYFGSYRVVGYDAWARARNGRIERVFAFVGDVGEFLRTLDDSRLRSYLIMQRGLTQRSKEWRRPGRIDRQRKKYSFAASATP